MSAMSEDEGRSVTVAPRAPDAYEAEFMSDGDIVHRDKITAPWWLQAGMAAGVLFSAVGGAFAAADGAPWLIFPFMLFWVAFVWANLYALRISVTRDKVHIQYGLFGPRIRVEDIVFCEAQKYNAVLKYGGWGLKYGFGDGSWAFNMPGDGGSGVMVHYRTRGGGIRKVFVSSHHPGVLADAINRARRAKGHDLPEAGELDDVALGLGDDVLFSEVQVAPSEAPQEVKAESVESE